ncbi:hypothetical protein Tco_0576064, partial [Tanacetum coccineum]
ISKEVGTPRYPSLVVPLKKVGDEAVHKELGDRMERAATTASSLEAEQDSGYIKCQDILLGDVNAQTKFEITSKQPNDLSLSRGYTLGSGEDINAVRHILMLPVQVPAIKERDGFAEIIDFLKASSVHYALTVKSSIRKDLHLDDAEGTDCLPTATIFEELTRMGAKSTAWNEFSCSMASLIICLATNQKFNLSKYIFDSMVWDQQVVSEHKESIPTPSNDPQPSGEDSMQLTNLMVLCTKLQTQVLDLEKAKDAQAKEIATLKRVESSKDQESLGAPEDAS